MTGTFAMPAERDLTAQELLEIVQNLCDAEALEIISAEGDALCIPYMMNDAVEAFCILEEAEWPDDLPGDLENVTGAVCLCGGVKQELCLRTEEGDLLTIRYGRCLYKETLYRYHRIMHCWESGYEHMRMLVYMVGTVSDKRHYLGERAVNDLERAFIPLIEYKPFRDFSPIAESLDAWYPDTETGADSMRSFALEAGEGALAQMIAEADPADRKTGDAIRRAIGASEKLFSCIYEKICLASAEYAERAYPPAAEEKMRTMREEADRMLKRAGYSGNYPEYFRKSPETGDSGRAAGSKDSGRTAECGRTGDTEGSRTRITVFEEHPFVLPGMDELEFALHFLCRKTDGSIFLIQKNDITGENVICQ
ncbi:MAG: DUF3878 family protein [Clostridium sp.]|nr:DUF3878 family protein [Clostridium sp.]